MTLKGIAISGKAGAGKDTVAEAIIETLAAIRVPARNAKLAAPIYTEAIELGMDPNNKDRPLLQKIGTERVKLDPAYYPRTLLHSKQALDDALMMRVPVVTDLRKIIEAEYLRTAGFKLVRLDVDPEIQAQRLSARDGSYDPATLTHWTEVDLDHYAYFDVKLPNNGFMTPQAIAWVILTILGYKLD